MLLAFLLLRTLIQTFHVDGPSMNPNFETDQRLLVNKVIYWHVEGTPFEGLIPSRPQGSIDYVFGGPNRGDVVIFRPPGPSDFDSDLIKRIIGLPGEAVAIQDGHLFVNSRPIDEPYIAYPADYTYPGPDLEVVVPNDSYFVLGDNRRVSADSPWAGSCPLKSSSARRGFRLATTGLGSGAERHNLSGGGPACAARTDAARPAGARFPASTAALFQAWLPARVAAAGSAPSRTTSGSKDR